MVALGVTGALAALEPAPPPRPVLAREWEDPPPEIAALVKRTQAGSPAERDEAAQALAKLPEAEPYLRFATLLGGDKRLVAVHTKQLAAIDQRNIARAEKWLANGRIDLIVEAVCLARTDAAADALTEPLITFSARTADQPPKVAKPAGGKLPRPEAASKSMAERAKIKGLVRLTGEEVKLARGNKLSGAVVRAGRFDSEPIIVGSIVVVRDEWKIREPILRFHDTIAFTNADIVLCPMSRCIVVIDGDVTQWGESTGGCRIDDSVVIARGSIGPAWIHAHGPDVSCVWSDRGIEIATPEALSGLALLSGGAIKTDVDTKTEQPRVVKEKLKENPFGVRFFETKDVGAEVEADEDGVRIASLAPNSPLAAQGLRVGDVVVRINDTEIDSVKEFRRELRRSVVCGAGVFWLKGEGRKPTRVVHFSDALP